MEDNDLIKMGIVKVGKPEGEPIGSSKSALNAVGGWLKTLGIFVLITIVCIVIFLMWLGSRPGWG